MPRFVSDDEIRNLTAYHPPKDVRTVEAHETVRRMVRHMALELNGMLAESPHKIHLIRQILPELMMRANQIIAVHGLDPEWVAQAEEQPIDPEGKAADIGG